MTDNLIQLLHDIKTTEIKMELDSVLTGIYIEKQELTNLGYVLNNHFSRILQLILTEMDEEDSFSELLLEGKLQEPFVINDMPSNYLYDLSVKIVHCLYEEGQIFGFSIADELRSLNTAIRLTIYNLELS